jgi:hypothetical protein
MARKDLNRLGASIGKLDGWSGTQTHDDIKMLAAGKEAWVRDIIPRLNMERTFPDASPDEIAGILGDMFDTIITGVTKKVSAAEKGQRVNPANLARSLGKSRVLHFKDSENALAYREQYGHGNTVSGMIGHFRRSAQLGAVMQALWSSIKQRTILDKQRTPSPSRSDREGRLLIQSTGNDCRHLGCHHACRKTDRQRRSVADVAGECRERHRCHARHGQGNSAPDGRGSNCPTTSRRPDC